MAEALKPEGIIDISFKYGNYKGERNGRYFTDFTLESFQDFIQDVNILKLGGELKGKKALKVDLLAKIK